MFLDLLWHSQQSPCSMPPAPNPERLLVLQGRHPPKLLCPYLTLGKWRLVPWSSSQDSLRNEAHSACTPESYLARPESRSQRREIQATAEAPRREGVGPWSPYWDDRNQSHAIVPCREVRRQRSSRNRMPGQQSSQRANRTGPHQTTFQKCPCASREREQTPPRVPPREPCVEAEG